MRSDRAYISGHVPLDPDGFVAHPLGKVGAEVSEEQAYEVARLTALAMLGSLIDRLVPSYSCRCTHYRSGRPGAVVRGLRLLLGR